MNFWMLSKMRRPSSTALRIDAKLSSVRIMSDDSLATSEPVPIAIPISARLRLGLSLTPSPVMATYLSRLCSASIIRTLVLGAQRATTRGSCGSASICSSDSASNWCAVIIIEATTSAGSRRILSGGGRMLTSAAMARAVCGWSPVSMWTMMPAPWQARTLGRDSGRGGS